MLTEFLSTVQAKRSAWESQKTIVFGITVYLEVHEQVRPKKHKNSPQKKIRTPTTITACWKEKDGSRFVREGIEVYSLVQLHRSAFGCVVLLCVKIHSFCCMVPNASLLLWVRLDRPLPSYVPSPSAAICRRVCEHS